MKKVLMAIIAALAIVTAGAGAYGAASQKQTAQPQSQMYLEVYTYVMVDGHRVPEQNVTVTLYSLSYSRQQNGTIDIVLQPISTQITGTAGTAYLQAQEGVYVLMAHGYGLRAFALIHLNHYMTVPLRLH